MSAESFALTMNLEEGHRARVLCCLQRARVKVHALRTTVSGSNPRRPRPRLSAPLAAASGGLTKS